MAEAIDRPAEHVRPLDGERDPRTWQSLSQPRLAAHRTATDPPPESLDDCDFQGLVTKTGEGLVEHIRSMSVDCVNRLFIGHDFSAPESLIFATFQAPNQIVVAGAAARLLAATYDGTNASQLRQLFLYLRAGSYVRFSNPKHFDREDEVTAALKEAIDAFVANERYYDESAEHASILANVHAAMDRPGLRVHYLSLIPARLGWWQPRHAENADLWYAVNAMFLLLYNAHREPEFTASVATNVDLVESLRDFALDSWMVGTAAELAAANAARELARLLQYDTASIYPLVRTAVQQILERYSPAGFGESIWLAAAEGADLDDCAHYAICDFEATTEARVLSGRHSCSETLLIRSENLSQSQLDHACALLTRQERIFHRRLGTNREPLDGDLNERLEMVVFANYDSYQQYSNLFFGNRTDNGGIYLEGNPLRLGNTARFIAYTRPDLPGEPIWNLEHEYIHYLDGRFNMSGGFRDYRTSTHHTVWWLEGLAEYMSKRENHQTAVNLARIGELPLSLLFETTYSHNTVRVYRWSYLAARFFFEQRSDDVEEFLRFFRAGDYDGYRNYLESIAPSLQEEWRNWLKKEVDALADTAAADYVPDTTLTTFEDAETTITLDVSQWFAGFDARPHEITVSNSNPDVAKVTLRENLLTISAVALGTATVVVRVETLWSVETQRLPVTVTNECPRELCPSFTQGWRMWVSTESAAAPSPSSERL